MHLYTRIFIKITKSSIIRGTSSCYEIHGILLLKNRERDSIHYEFVVPLPSLFTMLRIVDSLANRTVLATQLPVLVEFLVEILFVGAPPQLALSVGFLFESLFVGAPFSLFCLLESLFLK